MDERLGRATAKHLGLSSMGLVGLLILRKQRGLISKVRPRLEALRDVAGFHLGEELFRRVLSDESEG